MRLHCIFADELPEGATVEVEGASPCTVTAPAARVVLDVDTSKLKIGKSKAGGVMQAVSSTVSSGFSALSRAVVGSKPGHEDKWSEVRVRLPSSGQGAGVCRSWKVQWGQNDVNVALLLEAKAAAEMQIPLCLGKALDALHSNVGGQIALLLGGVLDQRLKVCVSVEGQGTCERERNIFDRVGNVIARVERALTDSHNWRARLMVSAAPLCTSVSQATQRTMVGFAVADLLQAAEFACLGEYSSKAYTNVEPGLWRDLESASRLALVIALHPQNRARGDICVFNHTGHVLTETTAGGVSSDLDKQSQSFKLLTILDGELPKGVSLSDASIAAAGAVALAKRKSAGEPLHHNDLKWKLTWRGASVVTSEVAAQVLQYLVKNLNNQPAQEEFKALVLRDLIPEIVRDRGPTKTHDTFRSFFGLKELSSVAVQHAFKTDQTSITSWCEQFLDDLWHNANVLAPLMLEDMVKEENRRFFRADDGLVFVQALCQDDHALKGGARAVRMVMEHANLGHLLEISRRLELQNRSVKEVDWIWCQTNANGARVAMQIAEHWLKDVRSIEMKDFCDKVRKQFAQLESFRNTRSAAMSSNREDIREMQEQLRSICCFLAEVQDTDFLAEGILQNLRSQVLWAKRTVAVLRKRGGDKVEALASIMRESKESIPTSFLAFLAASALDQKLELAYQEQLLDGVLPSDVQIFLPVADFAGKQRSRLEKLSKWLESYKVFIQAERDGIDFIAQGLNAVEEGIQTSQLSTFPECVGRNTTPEPLQRILDAFDDDSMDSNLVKYHVRRVLRKSKDGIANADLWSALLAGREEAKSFLRRVFAGEVMVKEVLSVSTSSGITILSGEAREAKSLRHLMLNAPVKEESDDAFATFVALVRVRPGEMLSLAEGLIFFFAETLEQNRAPQALEEFLKLYKQYDLDNLPVFGEAVPFEPSMLETKRPSIRAQGSVASLHHMFVSFKKILHPCARKEWDLIQFLPEMSQLVKDLRIRQDERDLDGKMDKLRILSITNNDLASPVAALDGLVPYVQKVIECKTIESIADLLPKIREAKINLNAGEDNGFEDSSLEHLAELFRHTEDAQDVAQRNLDSLIGAKIVIKSSIFDHDLYSSETPASALFIECQRFKERMASCLSSRGAKCFQLGGGKTCCDLDWHDSQALMAEIVVQKEDRKIDERQDNNVKAGLAKVARAQARLKAALLLAEAYQECARLGDTSYKQSFDSSGRKEFKTRAPRVHNTGFLPNGFQRPDAEDIHEIRTEKVLVKAIELKALFEAARKQCPWISFCPAQFVMPGSRCTTAWLLRLAGLQHTFALDRAEPVNDVAKWCLKVQQDQAEGGSSVEVVPGLKASTLDHVFAIQVNTECVMSTAMQVLCAIGEWPYARATSLFPCDDSAIPSAIDGLVWRLNHAARLLRESAVDEGVAQKHVIGSLFLCNGLVIVRPELLSNAVQAAVLAAVDVYAQAASKVAFTCHKVVMVLANDAAGEQFKLRMQTRILLQSDLPKIAGGFSFKNVRVFGTSVSQVARGERSARQVPKDVHRIRVGKDMSVLDLVKSVYCGQQKDKCICLDLGSDAGSVLKSHLAGALLSFFMCGVLGQAQHAAVALDAGQAIYVEGVHCTEGQLDNLNLVDPSFWARAESSEEAQLEGEEPAEAFEKLIQKARKGGQVDDRDVVEALAKTFSHNGHKVLPVSARESHMPFVHCTRSLETMGLVARRLRECVLESAGPINDEVSSGLPILLSGDTGTGKTYVILKFVELLRCSQVIRSFDPDFLRIHTFSANFLRGHIEVIGEMMHRETEPSDKGLTRTIRPFVLDEITSSPAQEALSRLICFRERKDGSAIETVLKRALIFSSCNPETGRDSVFQMMHELQYASIKVEPLGDEERNMFVKSQLKDGARGPGLTGQKLETVAKLVLKSMAAADSVPAHNRLGTTSLRDGVRCAALMRRLGARWSGDKSFFDSMQCDSWLIKDETERIAVTACYLCFGMRIRPRAHFYRMVLGSEKAPFLEQLKSAVLSSLAVPQTVVPTDAVRDNVLAVVVAISARLPLLCLGHDGTSKTLSLNMVVSQMRGQFSGTHLLQGLPRVQTFNLQLSRASTAEHILALKKTVVGWNAGGSTARHPCVCMEEISMADSGPSGPLRALHDLLDSHQETRARRKESETQDVGTGCNDFSFIATSNYHSDRPSELPTGRALGNRMLVLAHDSMPAENLIRLAVNSSLGEMRGVSAEGNSAFRQDLERTVDCLCREQQGGCLVPDEISIRSLLYFSRALAKLLVAQVPLREAQTRAFASHLQLQTPERTEALWKKVAAVLGLSEEDRCIRKVEVVIEDAFQHSKTRRPLLFLYNNLSEIHAAMECLKPHGEVRTICPGAFAMVDPNQTAAENESIAMRENAVLHSMVQLRTMLTQGGTIVVLNPEPILQGIHALLNEPGAHTSQLQMKQSNESVVIHRNAQIVLLVQRTAALGLHRALLSRVAVVNNLAKQTSTLPRPLIHFKEVYENVPDYDVVEDSKWMQWREKEEGVLSLVDVSFEDFFKEMDMTSSKVLILLLPGPIPYSLLGQHIDRVDAAIYAFPTDFASMVISMIDKQEAAMDLEEPSSEGRILLLDLTQASPSGAIECMALLGLAGAHFEHESRMKHDRLLSHARKQGVRVVIALNHSKHPKLRVPRLQLRGKGDPRHIAYVIHMQYFFRPFPEWGLLTEIAESPSLLFDRCKDELERFFLRAVDTEDKGGFDTSGRAAKLRREMVDSALRYCFPRDANRILFVTEDMDAGQSKRSMHIARKDLFKDIADYLCKDTNDKNIVIFRVLLIKMCRHLCYKVGSQMLQKLPAHFFRQPKELYVRFLTMVLKSGNLTWQCNYVPVGIGSEIHSQAYMTPSARAGIGIPFLQDILNTAHKVMQCRRDDRIELDASVRVSQSIGLSFPTLDNFSLDIEASDLSATPEAERRDFSKTLAESLMQISCGSDNVGRDYTIPCGWLLRARWNGGTFGGMIGFFCKHRQWLEAASFVQMGHNPEFLEKNAFEDEIVSFFKAVLEGRSGLKPFSGSERSLQLALEHAMLTCTTEKGKQTSDYKWLQQVMRVWAAFEDLSLALGLVDPKVTVGRARALIEPLICIENLYTFLTVLDACDAEQCLPSAAIAAAIFWPDISYEYAGSLLATAARRRENSTLPFLTDVMVHAFSENLRFSASLEKDVVSAPMHISLCKETEIVAMALCNLDSLDARQLLEHVILCEKELNQIEYVILCEKELNQISEKVRAYQAMRLAAASAGIPKLVQIFTDMLDNLPDLCDSDYIEGGWMLEVFKPSSSPNQPNEVQAFLVRCLVASLGHGRLSLLSPWLPQMVGDWISPYLSNAFAPMSDLEIFFEHSRAPPDDEGGWPCNLSTALSGRGIQCGEDIERALAGDDLLFCDQSAGAWYVMLQALAPSSVFASDAYCKESALSNMTVPCALPSPLEFKLDPNMTLNECSCGYKYFIGNCGQPGSSKKCPECELMLGGEGHVYNAGQRKLDVGAYAGVRGIDVLWFVPGARHTERDLSPLAYRILSVLLLIPLAMFSENRDRVKQLERHWDALKDVTGLSSDQDTQHFILGVLKNSHDQRCFESLAHTTGKFDSVQARDCFEGRFVQALETCLGFCSYSGIRGQRASRRSDLEGMRVAVRDFVDGVQDKYDRQPSCLALQEGKISRLPENESAQKFASNILRLRWPRQRAESESLGMLRAHLVDYFANHPLLTKVLFSSTSGDAEPSIQSAHDLDEPEKIGKFFWPLFEGLACVHDLARNGTSSVLDLSVRDLLQQAGQKEALLSLSKAWNRCKTKHQVECQEVDDLGDILMMPVSLVAWLEEQDDKSRTETILQKLVDAHNNTVLLIKGLKLEGEDKDEELSRIKAGIPTVELTWDTKSDVFDTVVPKLRNARHWLEEHMDHLPIEACDAADEQKMEKIAADVQEIVRKLLDAQQLALFSLVSWKKIVRAPNSIVQVSPETQASSIPQETEKAFKEHFQRFGMQEDEVLKALEWAQRQAVLIDRAGGAIQRGTALHDLNGSSKETPKLMRHVISATSASGQGKALQVKHINALQEYLARLLHKRPEDGLPQTNRVELPDKKAFIQVAQELKKQELRVLLLKLELWCKTRAGCSSAAWTLCDCLSCIEEVDGENLCEESAWLFPLRGQGLQNMHSYHALSALRELKGQ